MAKLPVLYAPLFGGKLDTNDDEVELAELFVRKADALVEHGPDFIEYIPAKRCKTCASWSASHCYGNVPGADELAGAGFCHNHEDAQ